MRYRSFGDPSPLFCEGNFFNLIETRRQALETEIQAYDNNRLLNTPTDDLVSYFRNKFIIEVPTLQPEQAQVDQQETQVQVRDQFASFRGGHEDDTIVVPGIRVDLTVPFVGDSGMFRIRPNTFGSMPPYALVLDSALIVRVQGRTLTQEQVKHELDATLQSIEQYLQWQRDSAAEFNRSIENASRIAIEARKQKLLSAQSLVAGLGFKLKERPDAPKTYSAPEVRRKIEPFMPKASTAPYKPEPVLDESHYTVILDTMENMAHVMERSPSAFNNMGEEDLRQHFLVQLNGRFEGAATGETFNYQGKTDILIRSGDRNIFIAECKFWHGEKAFKDTVDQLLSYLSWRDTKTAVVIFNRNKNFGAVLSSIKTAMSNHQHTKKGPTVQGESRFRYVLGNPSDHSREVIVTVMAFDIPT